MGILTGDMKRMVREQRLGFMATVCPDGTPNLSPKGTIAVWDDDHLVFADLASPGTMANLRANPAIEINVVDPFLRKGYRFKGTAAILSEGPVFEHVLDSYRRDGVIQRLASSIRSIVLVKVAQALPLVSPAYTPGVTEEQVRAQWEQYWGRVTEQYHARPRDKAAT
jgi:predicted pyridoxine 5'-phosphate oxidase superfamily flavin-nucleotide-binding protein